MSVSRQPPIPDLTDRGLQQANSFATFHLSPFRLNLSLVVILLIASAFRFVGLDSNPSPFGISPPGLEHDEVAHWLINHDILSGNHAIYFTEAYGHEALYHYLQTGIGVLVGDHALGLRLPSAYLGVLLVAVSYALGKRLFGLRVGLWSAAFVAVLFWPVFYSRLALRAISLPVFSGLAAYWWWMAFGPASNANEAQERGTRSNQKISSAQLRSRATLQLFLAGLLAGLSLHTYMAARAVPIFFAIYTLYLGLFYRTILRRHAPGIILFWLALALVAAPLVLFLLANPGAEVRIAEVDAPLRALRSGDLKPVLDNALKIAAMFGLYGDPLWRQNIAGQPVFDPVLGLLFYGGVLLSLWRWRDRRHAFILLWLATSTMPSLVTVDAPSSIRIINLLPVLMFFPLVLIHTTPYLSTIRDKFSTDLTTRVVSFTLTALLILSGYITVNGLWRTWPANDEVRFVWQAALTQAAAYMDESAESGPVAVGGWTPETLDRPTIELALRREDLSLRYFDPGQGVIIPSAPAGESIRIVTPAILPLATSITAATNPVISVRDDFILYTLSPRPEFSPMYGIGTVFADELRLIGFDLDGPCTDGQACEVIAYWEVITPANGPRRMFLHAVDGGDIISQDDGLAAPSEHWQPGDILIQRFTLPVATADLRIGVYDPVTEVRLMAANGMDFIPLEIR